MTANVNIIDPNEVISELPTYMNGSPDYENMFIFVELTATRKKRTVLRTDGVGQGSNIFDNGLDKDVKISMMGYDQSGGNKKGTPNKYSTKYLNNTSTSEHQDLYEGFGIHSIRVNTNSSYIPKVNIDFIDTRGSSFAQTEDAPYNILFDFPPPIYRLTLKGYYGRGLSFDLHLIKYNVQFSSQDGSYLIGAEFVARTFAPLTDVLFKYIINFPLMENATGERSAKTTLPDANDDDGSTATANANNKFDALTTFELIRKLENLNDDLNKLKDSSQESQELDAVEEEEKALNLLDLNIVNFNTAYSLDGEVKNNGVFIIRNNELNDKLKDFRIGQVTEYRKFLRTKGSQTVNLNIEKSLLIAYQVADSTNTTRPDSAKSAQISRNLYKLRTEILKDAQATKNDKFLVRNNKNLITPTVSVTEKENENTYASETLFDSTNNKVYQFIDITNLYQEIYLRQDQISKSIREKRSQLVGLINETVYETLGFKPTIYNIFRVLCNDVDRFYDKLKVASMKAETHHEDYKNKIISKVKDSKNNQVLPFPLFVSAQTVCNVTRQVRRIPTSKALGYTTSDLPEFPEAQLVFRFMESFLKLAKDERRREMKTQADELGYNKWIPVTPADSELYKPNDRESPYYNIYDNANAKHKIYSILLNRFYVQSQFTYGLDFFREGDETKLVMDKTGRDNLVRLLAESEAVNIANSLAQIDLINGILDDAEVKFKGGNGTGYNRFIEYMEKFQKTIPNYSSLPNDDFLTLTNKTDLYRDRANDDYIGIKILVNNNDSGKFKSGKDAKTKETANPIDTFLLSENDEGWFSKFLNLFKYKRTLNDSEIRTFTETNSPIFQDVEAGRNINSRYLLSDQSIGLNSSLRKTFETTFNKTVNSYNETNSSKIINELADGTETVLANRVYPKNEYGGFLSIWSDKLGRNVEDLIDFFNSDYSSEFKSALVVSNFFNSVGYFNDYGSVNSFFKYPSVVYLPYYSPLYMGALVEISDSLSLQNELVKFMGSSLGRKLRRYEISRTTGNVQTTESFTGPTYTFFDLKKIELLAEKDKDEFYSIYKFFDETKMPDVIENILVMLNAIKEEFPNTRNVQPRINKIRNYLNGDEENYNESITKNLNKKVTILNFSQLTFNDSNNAIPTTYRTLSELKDSTNNDVSEATKNYFEAFFAKLPKVIDATRTEIIELEKQYASNVTDNDIATQTYYSFKNINDKWISGNHNKNVYGFPYNTSLFDKLINKFAFVDRAMNPIGDSVIINAESLIDMSKDYDLSVFTVMSRLLAQNGFEFFPLQNFMAYNNTDWKDAFKIFPTVEDQLATPAFVCMFIGGTASYLKNENSDFPDDGLDLNNMTDVSDFDTRICPESNEINNLPNFDKNPDFPFSRVHAFRVRYGEQNQSMFKDIDIDSKEHPETNESMAILSKIAQDQSTASPVPKAQNLYNTFESRSYSAKVEMMGNVMIQPTQYFQLENIPIFSGAYIVLDVEHVIKPNNMSTSFTGVKVLKFPNPFVTEYATVVGLNEGGAQDTSGNIYAQNSASAPEETSWGDAGAGTLPAAAEHNSMYNLLVKPITENQTGE